MVLFFLFSLFFIPFKVADSANRNKSTADFYIPQSAVSKMNQAEKLPTLNPQIPALNQPVTTPNAGVISPPTYRPMSGSVNAAKQPKTSFRKAPIDDILAKQPFPKPALEKYKKHIVRSYYLLPKDLKTLLRKETKSINDETRRIQQIRAGWKTQSPAYKFINYQLNEQINNDIINSRKKYQKRRQAFEDFFKTAPKNKYVSVIESTDRLFWMRTLAETNVLFSYYVQSNHELYFISVFDHEHRHVFTYHRLHVDANRNRRIVATDSGNPEANRRFQKLFNDYSTDLRRIGTGLDIVNPELLRQIGEMQNRYITESY